MTLPHEFIKELLKVQFSARYPFDRLNLLETSHKNAIM